MNNVSLTTRLPGDASRTRSVPREFVHVVRGDSAWMVSPELTHQLLSDSGLRLTNWLEAGCADIVKDGRHRTVYRLRLDSGVFYLKHYKVPRVRNRLQNLVRPCRAAMEWNAAVRVAALGIPTFEAVAVGHRRWGPFIADNFLITREIPNAIPLDDYLLGDPATSVSAGVRQSLAIQLGELVARLHAGKLVHADLHAGNILIRIGGIRDVHLWLIDLHPVKRRWRMSAAGIEHNLSLLNNFFARLATPADRRRFFGAYARTLQVVSSTMPAGFGTACSSLRSLSRRIDAYCDTAVQRSLRKADAKWITGNRRLIIANSRERRCRAVSAFGGAKVREIRENPDLLFADQCVRAWSERTQGRESAVVDVSVNAQTLKRCCVTAVHDVKLKAHERLFGGRSAVRRVWEAGHALARRSLACPLPLLFVEYQDANRLQHQYLLIEPVTNAVKLSELVNAWMDEVPSDEPGRTLDRCLNRLAGEIRWMHACGIEHRALTADNILVSQTANGWSIAFCNLEAVRLRRRLNRKRIVASLATLNASVPLQSTVRATERLRFLRRLLNGPLNRPRSRTAWKGWWREIARASERVDASRSAEPRLFPDC